MVNWDKSAIKEQKELEESQEEAMDLSLLLKYYNGYIFVSGRCFGKTFCSYYIAYLFMYYELKEVM